MPTLPEPSSTLSLGFIALSLAMLLAMVGAVTHAAGRRAGVIAAVGLGAWAALNAGLAASGFLMHFEPPRILLLLVVMAGALLWLLRSDFGARMATLPLLLLLGFQGFRVLVELLIHQAVVEGIAPEQMTWTGWNLDIVTGVSALVMAPLVGKVPARVVRVWNLVCAGLLGVVIVVAVLSMPTPLRVFQNDPPNIWIAQFPFVWLPAVLVFVAFAGHILTARHLAAARGS